MFNKNFEVGRFKWSATNVATAVAFSFVISGSLSAQDWTNWRGPEQNGISRDTNLADSWSFAPPKNVEWIQNEGGRSTPIILNGRVYIDCRTPDDVNDPVEKINAREQVVCMDAETGKVIWRDVFNVFQTDIPAPRVGWAAMCGDKETGYVYVHSVSGIFRCYDADGKIIWERSLAEEYGKISGYGGRTQTPIIDEDRVIVSFMATNWGDEKGPGPLHYYYAFDKKTGEVQWKSAPGEAPKDTNYSVPVVAVINGQRQLIGGNCDGHMYSINARTGKPIWKFRMSLAGLNASPVVDGNYVYISHGEDNIDNSEFGRIQCIDATGTGDVTETKSVWRVDGIKAGYTALLAYDGIVYVVADTGNLYAFDSKDGKQLWQHDLGTVGKGSPIWADGKIYATEVNGHMWILKPSREKCDTLSEVIIPSLASAGPDEIYASPAVADGKIYLVTRDRTICISDKNKQVVIGQPKPMAAEAPPSDVVDMIQLRPYEMIFQPGEKITYSVYAFDPNGRFLAKMPAENLKTDESLAGFKVDGSSIVAPNVEKNIAGTAIATVGTKTASARVRMFNPAKVWKWDFEGLKGVAVPAAWSRAHVKLKPTDLDGNTAMKVAGGTEAKGRPSHQVTIGPPGMKDFEIQCDVLLKEQARKLASVGLSDQRYNFIVQGNISKIGIQSWPPHKRMAKEAKFVSEPDVWYTMKMKVETTDKEAKVYGKVWKRSEPEPEAWSLEATDPHPNMEGPPGLYFYAQADCYFDNVIVTQK